MRHHVIAINENSEQNLHIWSNLTCFFVVLSIMDASMGMIGLWFQYHSYTPMVHSRLTVPPCGTNSWGTTLFQSTKTVSRTFTFGQIWRAFLWSWLLWTLPLGWLGFGFNIIAIHLWFIAGYYLLKQIWICVEHCQHLLSGCVCLKFRTIFAGARFMPKTSINIAWHE